MIHEKLDMAHWKSVFPLEGFRDDADLLAMQITSPCDLAVFEQLRDEAIASLDVDVETAPVDVFVFGKGEARLREATKVGGVPYWPADREWPKDEHGKPMIFIEQICFADSRDIAGILPGDVLLVFGADTDEGWYASGRLLFEWQPLGLPDLIGQKAVPSTSFTVVPCYGVIHRTHDYPQAEVDLHEDLLPPLDATKIGGFPWWQQEEEKLPGRYLCTLASIQPADEMPYPWINMPEPIVSFDDMYNPDFLMWGDLGDVYVFIDDAGSIHWEIQCG